MKHITIKNICWIILNLLLFPACEQKTDWTFNIENDFLVVDAIITNEYKIHEIQVNRFNGQMNTKAIPVSGVRLSILSRYDTIAFIESPDEPGKYLSEYPFRSAARVNYKLTLNYQNFYDTAQAEMTAIDDMEALPIIKQDSLFKIQYIASSLPSMTDVFYDWSSNNNFCQQSKSCVAWETYYTLQTVDIQKEFAAKKEIIFFPHETNIIRNKYSLSSAHQDFIRSLLIETEWRGSLFDIEQGNVPSNFKYGSRGWFGVCMVLRDTTFFE